MNLDIDSLFNSFNKSNILVVGDSMIDSYVWGKIDRMSPEAPVPLLNVTKKESRIGGAANVALNLKALGAKVKLCSVVGDDYKSKIFKELLERENISTDGIISEKNRITTEKKRIISEKYFSRNYNKHHIRIDDEIIEDINDEKTFISLIKNQMNKIDAIILQDYNKGNLTKNVIEQVISYANKKNIPTLCDPKIKNFYSFKNCTLIKPNLSEIRNGGGIKINPESNDEVTFATKKLQERLNCDIIMLTMSENGMQIKTESSSTHFKNVDRKIVDVSGAGDTVISVAALCLSQNTSIELLGFLSNLAGGIVCEYSGVVKLDKEKLYKEAISHYNKS